jgi:hypothetical protein
MSNVIGKIDVRTTGVTIATGAASARAAVPNNTSNASPMFVRVTATVAAYVKAGDSSVTAAAGDLLVQPGDAVVLKFKGATHIAAIQASGAGIVQISPLEDSL